MIRAKEGSMPNIRYLSYSTCSIFREENEDVVGKILEEFKDQVELVPISVEEFHKGHEGMEVVRVCPKCSGRAGFFVALFKFKY